MRGGFSGINSILQHEGQAGRDKDDAVGECCDLLVEAAGGVAEVTAERRLGDETHPDLVADEHDRPTASRKALHSTSLRLGLSAGQEQVRQPQGQAIDENGTLGSLGSDGRGQIQRRLDGAPERAAARPMRGDALGHLGVARFRGRAIGAPLAASSTSRSA